MMPDFSKVSPCWYWVDTRIYPFPIRLFNWQIGWHAQQPVFCVCSLPMMNWYSSPGTWDSFSCFNKLVVFWSSHYDRRESNIRNLKSCKSSKPSSDLTCQSNRCRSAALHCTAEWPTFICIRFVWQPCLQLLELSCWSRKAQQIHSAAPVCLEDIRLQKPLN